MQSWLNCFDISAESSQQAIVALLDRFVGVVNKAATRNPRPKEAATFAQSKLAFRVSIHGFVVVLYRDNQLRRFASLHSK
jgi:hypothetical protein